MVEIEDYLPIDNILKPQFCDDENLLFVHRGLMDGDAEILFYFIYNIPSRMYIHESGKYRQYLYNQDAQGCSSKYLVYCECNRGCGSRNAFLMKHTDISNGVVHVDIYDDFNCYAKNIKTGEVKTLLDKLKNDVANDPNIWDVGFLYTFGGSTFQMPAVYEDKVVLSYLIYDYTYFYLLLVDINNPSDYKLIPTDESDIIFPPVFNGEYIVWGGFNIFNIYNIQTGQTKEMKVMTSQSYTQGIELLSVPIYYPDFTYRNHPYSLSGDNIIFTKYKTEDYGWKVNDIYLYNIKSEEQKLIYSNNIDSTSAEPVIWDDKIVWMQAKRAGRDNRANLAETSIMLYNLTTGELREIVPEKPNPLWPTTNGRYIAWLDTEAGDEEKGRSPDVYLYDIETGETWKVSPHD